MNALLNKLGPGIQPSFRINRDPESYSYIRGGTTQLTLGNWHHIVVTYDGENLNYYVNSTSHTQIPMSGFLIADPYDLVFGRYISGTAYYFNGYYICISAFMRQGSIDEVRVYNRVLSADEVNSRFNGNDISNGLAGSWPFEDDESSGQITDVSGNNNTGFAFTIQSTNNHQERLTMCNILPHTTAKWENVCSLMEYHHLFRCLPLIA